MLRVGNTLKRWRLSIGNNPGQGTRIVSSIEMLAFQLKFNKTIKEEQSGRLCGPYLMQNNIEKFFLMLHARGTEALFLRMPRWTEHGQARGEKIHDTLSIRLHHQGGRGHVWASKMDASRSISRDAMQKDLLRRAENNVFYLALGKYRSYLRDTSSYVENSILYKVLGKIGKIYTFLTCGQKNNTPKKIAVQIQHRKCYQSKYTRHSTIVQNLHVFILWP